MVEFLLGVLFTGVLASFGYACFSFGRNNPKTAPKEVTEEEEKRLEALAEMNQGYNKVLNYSIEQAFKARERKSN